MKKTLLISVLIIMAFSVNAQYLLVDTVKSIPPAIKVEQWQYDSHDYYNVQANGVGVNYIVTITITVDDSIMDQRQESRSIFLSKLLFPTLHTLLTSQVVQDSVKKCLIQYLE